MKHKKLFISLTAVLSVLIFLAIFLMVWFFGDNYSDFYGKFSKEFEIQGLDDGAVPQGMTSYEISYTELNDEGLNQSKKSQFFFVSAYMADKSASRIYVTRVRQVKGSDDEVSYEYDSLGYVTVKGEDGKDFKGHVGGIATNGSNLWLSCDGKIYCAKASEDYSAAKKDIAQEIIEKTAEKGSIRITASFDANCNASFLYYYNDPYNSSPSYDKLYVGEFYREGNYETDKLHRVKTPTGYQNTAFMYEYTCTSTASNKYGLSLISTDKVAEENKVPKIDKIYSIPEKVQGVAFSGRTRYNKYDGILVLSQSYGLADSHLLCFDYSKVNAASAKYATVNGYNFKYAGVKQTLGDLDYTEDITVYYVDKTDNAMLVNDYAVPSMSEGMCSMTNVASYQQTSTRIYVLFESACKKYNLFVREKLDHVYSFTPTPKVK